MEGETYEYRVAFNIIYRIYFLPDSQYKININNNLWNVFFILILDVTWATRNNHFWT